jgi:phage terminase large subunit-like protein
MPWQQYVADVGGEVDDRGLPVYSLLLVSVPRQSGKTTLDLAQSIQRCLAAPRRKVWHTAQTGQVAREKFREVVEDVESSPLSSLVNQKLTRKGNGDEQLVFVNQSRFRPHKPGRDALHGEQSDLNNIDEAWVFDDLAGADLMQAITPTQLTRPGAQTWVWSTRGDRSSTWFHGMIDAIKAGAIPRAALFDWGIPEDADASDLQVIADHHPAFGHTVTMDSLRAAHANFATDPTGWARAYGNVPSGNAERVIPLDAWTDAGTTDPVPAGRPAYGIATSADGGMTAIAAAVLSPDGIPWVEVIVHRAGRSWAIEAARSLADAGQGVAIDRRGPAAPVADQLDLAGVDLLPMGSTDYAAACQDVFDRITHPDGPRIRLRAHEALDTAADVAGRRTISDGGWIWSRTRSTGDVSTLEAATLAAWAVLRNPAAEEAPFVVFG